MKSSQVRNNDTHVSRRPVERVGRGVSYPGPQRLGARARNIKYARIYHFEKSQKISPQRAP